MGKNKYEEIKRKMQTTVEKPLEDAENFIMTYFGNGDSEEEIAAWAIRKGYSPADARGIAALDSLISSSQYDPLVRIDHKYLLLMEEFVLSGTIFEARFEEMKVLMQTLLGDVQVKDNLYGDAIQFEDEKIHIFLDNSGGNGHDYAMNADFRGTQQDLKEFLAKFTEKLIEAGIIYDIGYYQIDENGNEIGGEVDLVHPEIQSFYAKRSAHNLK